MLQGDPRVVAALAVAILAVSPVVNAIMTKAAQQADVDLLRDPDADFPFKGAFDGAFQGEPPEGRGQGQGQGQGQGPGRAPPPPPLTPPPVPPCEPQLDGPDPVVLQGPASVQGERAEVSLTVEPGDVELVAQVRGDNVVGSPTFELRRDDELQWLHAEMHTRDSFTLPDNDEGVFPDPDPGVTWVLSVDTGTAAYETIGLALAVTRCAGGSP